MKTVEMYEIGELVLIKARVTDVVVDQGKLKYKIRVEHTNDDLEHTFTENQMQPMPIGLQENIESRFFVETPKDNVTPV